MVPVPKEGLRHSPREDAERFAQVCDGTGRRTETGGPALPCGPHRDHPHKGAGHPGFHLQAAPAEGTGRAEIWETRLAWGDKGDFSYFSSPSERM